MSERCSADEFGPINLTDCDEFEGGPTEWSVLNAEEKKNKKIGYERVKEKIKSIRQNYRKAVTEGTRSGSGKLICDSWDYLKHIWAGSPAVISINNSISSTRIDGDENENTHDDDDDDDDDEASNGGSSSEDSSDEADLIVNKKKKNDSKKSGSDSESQPISSKLTAKFVDNKRKQLEKNLSANQRDQQYLGLAAKDLEMKENMVKMLAESNTESNKVMEKMSESISSVGKSIGDGLALLAQALAAPQPRDQHPGFHPYMTSYPMNEGYINGTNNSGEPGPSYQNL